MLPPLSRCSESNSPDVSRLCLIATLALLVLQFEEELWWSIFNSSRQPLNGYYLGALLF